jgi:hypothetical protein
MPRWHGAGRPRERQTELHSKPKSLVERDHREAAIQNDRERRQVGSRMSCSERELMGGLISANVLVLMLCVSSCPSSVLLDGVGLGPPNKSHLHRNYGM